MLPRIEITGRAEGVSLRFTTTSKSVCNFTVVSHKLRRRNDQWQETDHTRLRCVCWDRLAEHVGDALTEGTEVTVIGELKQRDFRGVGDSEDQTRYEVTAKSVSLALPLKATRERPVESPDDPWSVSPPDDPWATDTISGEDRGNAR